MTDRSRWFRFRRWLSYKIMPGTDEYAVAFARQNAVHQLRSAAWETDQRDVQEQLERTADRLADRVPVRVVWDNAQVRREDESG